MDMRKMPDGWRLLAAFPMTASGEPVGFEVVAEHAVITSGPLVYVVARTVAPQDPETYMDARVYTDDKAAMVAGLLRAGWANVTQNDSDY